jgi:hypothetical protein
MFREGWVAVQDRDKAEGRLQQAVNTARLGHFNTWKEQRRKRCEALSITWP